MSTRRSGADNGRRVAARLYVISDNRDNKGREKGGGTDRRRSRVFHPRGRKRLCHSLLRRAEAPVGYERAAAGSVPGRGFASEATERGGEGGRQAAEGEEGRGGGGKGEGGEEKKKREEGTIPGKIVPGCLVPRPRPSLPPSLAPSHPPSPPGSG